MNITLPKSKILVAFLFFVLTQTIGFGATITSTASGGNWNSTGSWAGNVVPTATDDVVIASGSTVTVNVAVSARSITVSGTMSIPADSNISINSPLVVVTSPSGSIYFNKKSIIIFPTNVSLYLQNGSNSLDTGGSGVCSNNTEIHVGATNYAVCTGGGALYNFDQVETAGGINTSVILSGNQYICTYGTTTTTFTSTVSSGTWSSGSLSIATVNSSTGVVTAVAAGTATITYTVAGGGSATRDVYVAGSPGGGVSAINGSNSQCPGTTANYTITSNSANYNHTWSYASGTGVTFITSADGRSATATFASNATSGQITVNSTNACGSGYGNNFNVTVDPVPSAPGTAGPHSPSCTQFTAQWAYTSYATKYYLDVSTNSGFSSFVSGYNNLDVGNVLNYALTGLNPGTTYYYRVRAYGNCGTSPSSTTMNYATTASPTVAPTVAAATSIDCNQATLNWNSITNATAYYLDIATDSGFSTFVSGYNNLYIGYYPSSGYFAGSLPAGVLYYRVRATNVCNVTTGNSNTISFQTTAPLGGSVSPAQTICAGAVPTSNLTLSGHTTTAGTVIANWQSATDAAFTTNVAYISETTNVLTSAKIGVLNVSTYFRAVVQNQFGSWCSTNSTPVLITVNNLVSAASSSPTLCINTVMTNVTHTTSGFTGISNSDVSGANGLPAGVSASFASNVVTISGTPTASGTFNYSIPLTGGSCGVANATGTITVNAGLSGAPVTPNTAQNICVSASGTALTATPTGGGAMTYQWGKRSVSGGTITPIGGQITTSYTPTGAGLTAGTWFIVCTSTPTCGSQIISNEVMVTVRSAFTSGAIDTTGETICNGGTPTVTIGSATTASGGDTVITYSWRSSADGYTVSIPSATGATYLPPSGLTSATSYRRYAKDGTCNTTPTVSTGTWMVTVRSAFTSGAIDTIGETICNGGTPAVTIGSATAASGGDATITYSWRSSADGYTATIPSATGATYLPPSGLTATTSYRRYAKDGSCSTTPTVSTGTWTVTVNPTPTLTSATQTIFACDNSAATIKLSGLLAGSTSTVNYTINGVAQTPIANLTAVAGEISFNTRALTSADDGKLLQITGITTTSASPSCTKSFAGIAGIDLTLNVKSNSGAISLNNGTPIASGDTTTFSEKTTATFSIAAVPGATGYTWVVPAGWTILSGQGTREITVTTGTEFQSGNVTVTATNMFCPSSLGVTLTSIAPPAPAPNTVVPVKCNTLGSISFNNLPAGSWTLNVIKDGVSSGSIIGSGNIYTVGSLSAGTYTFTVTDAFGTSLASAPVLIDVVTITWNGSGWFIGSNPSAAPTLDDIVEFSGNYNGPDSINACSCTVKTGANATIASTKVLTVVNGVHVQAGGTLTFASGASLIQNNEAKNLNTGNIIYKRTAFGIKDFDYVYWSSPVADQTLGSLSPQSDKYWSWLVDSWTQATGADTMTEGKGYIARVPRYVTSQTVNFVGIPNNGDVTIATQGPFTSNLIGNPYPSAINADDFLTDNAAVLSASGGGMLSFWTHITQRNINGTGTQYQYESDDYAYYTLSGSTAALSAAYGVLPPDGTIAAGQSFFVGSGVIGFFKFTNSMRIGDDGANSQFFKQANTKKTAKIEKNRIWLNLTNSGGAFKQLLVGYIAGATNDADKLYDGTTRNGNAYVDFYSINNSKNYTIQGRGLPFDKTDEVPLGFKTTIEGTFQIGIDNVDGSMVNQAIYLEDKMTNTIHDLKTGSYSFTTAIGRFNDRFVLRYTNTSKLGTGDVEVKGKGVFVSVKNREIKINSFDQTMSKVMVYDLKGSLLYDKDKVNKNEFIINNLTTSNQFMIVMVQLEDGEWISEEIIFHD